MNSLNEVRSNNKIEIKVLRMKERERLGRHNQGPSGSQAWERVGMKNVLGEHKQGRATGEGEKG